MSLNLWLRYFIKYHSRTRLDPLILWYYDVFVIFVEGEERYQCAYDTNPKLRWGEDPETSEESEEVAGEPEYTPEDEDLDAPEDEDLDTPEDEEDLVDAAEEDGLEDDKLDWDLDDEPWLLLDPE